ncbi:MAG: hypothetical protein ACXWLH_04270 [Candidatus Saccharimonadales bacterium]
MSEAPLDLSDLQLKPYQTANPKEISGPNGSVVVYNISTDFQQMAKDHKVMFVPSVSAKGVSAYVDLIPNPPSHKEIALTPERREEIISSGNIPEVTPFMAGARMALAERQAKRHQRRAESALRSAHVDRHSAMSAAMWTASHLDDEFRPRTLPERAKLKRMIRLVRRANRYNTSANITEDMNTYLDKTETPSGIQKARRPGPEFDRHYGNLSFFEKRYRNGERKRYKHQRELSARLIHGQRIPLVGKRVGILSFARLANSGSKKVDRALEKRDKALRKAAALKQTKTT